MISAIAWPAHSPEYHAHSTVPALLDGDQVSPDVAMTLAAVDRLAHHSTIFELNAERNLQRADKTAQAPAGGKSLAKTD